MKFYEYGDKNAPAMMLIHGAGWSYWLYLQEARLLQPNYHVILPVLDGHGEEAHRPYCSTEKSADQLLTYIDDHCDGKLFALSGVSLGGQIAIELLSRRSDLAEKAIIESGLCLPQPALLRYSQFVYKHFGNLLFSPKFNQWALTIMPKQMQLPDEITALYLRDIPAVNVETMHRVFETYYHYTLKYTLKNSQADTIYWYGSKELHCIKQSGLLFQSTVKKCQLIELPGYRHSEISAYHPEEWVEKATAFFNS